MKSKGPSDATSYWSELNLLISCCSKKQDLTQDSIAKVLKNTVASTHQRRSLSEAILPVDYHESVPLAGHVVLLCTALKDLVHFITPLRQPLLPSRPILLVCPIHSSTGEDYHEAQAAWQEICEFSDVHVLPGDRSLTHDLTRAAIDRAAAVIVLNGHSSMFHQKRGMESELAAMDAQVILATLEAEKRCGRLTRIMSEVHNGLFSKNLGTTTEKRMSWKDPEGALAGAVAVAGEDFSSENERHLTKVLQHMDPGYAAGRILLTDYCDKLVSQAFFNPHIMPLLGALLNPSIHNLACAAVASRTDYSKFKAEGGRSKGLMSGHVKQIAIPKDFLLAATRGEQIAASARARRNEASCNAPEERSFLGNWARRSQNGYAARAVASHPHPRF